MVTQETIQRVLSLKLPPDNDADVATVRAYLVKLLHNVWTEEEGFDGKRPFGNSGWQMDIYKPMIEADIVDGIIDHDGYVEQFDEHAAERIVLAAIESLATPPKAANYIL